MNEYEARTLVEALEGVMRGLIQKAEHPNDRPRNDRIEEEIEEHRATVVRVLTTK